ncbi:MAG: shikimate kinase [Clostridium sp.]|jgi:shikimate kinase|uniref:shikimate kinase n=1 Tax=Clostridium arbusti TaxID=1137848 RepID=UPI000289FBB8|nr:MULTISPECIES: shikimate kinase [Clostridium]MDF2504479.1 shikimate kinase [Clostridium sp.]
MNLQKNIVFIGMPGSGKTTIAKNIAKIHGLKLYDTDEYIEKKEGKTITDIFKQGESYFRKLETQVVKEISSEKSVVISTGGGVIKSLDNMKYLKENGIVLFINRPIEDIIKDVDTVNRPLLKGTKEHLYKLYDERFHLYKGYCDYEIINDKDLKYVLDNILNIIRKFSNE